MTDIDPMEHVETDADDKDEDDKDEAEEKEERKRRGRLNTLVAITVALLATFIGVCHVKDDNIVQAMQQAQADKIDNYAWYQARNIREEVLHANALQMKVLADGLPPGAAKVEARAQAASFQKLADEQGEKKKTQQADAEKAGKDYNALNLHDDQFDLSDALLSIAISLLALTALTAKRWLYVVALVPTGFGVLFGLAGLLGWHLHPDALTRLLS